MTAEKKGPFFIFVGGHDAYEPGFTSQYGGVTSNGGGAGEKRGGGATDIRLKNSSSLEGLVSRIMVAAGGGGGTFAYNLTSRGDGGGITGYDADGDFSDSYHTSPSNHYSGYGASQTQGGACGLGGGVSDIDNGAAFEHAAGSFGIGGWGYNPRTESGQPSSGGGGGYYGGGHGVHPGSMHSGGGGGSSFISGHPGCNAVGSNATLADRKHTDSPNHYSGYVFSNTEMIDGRGYKWTSATAKTASTQPQPNGSNATGHADVGYARITITRQ